MSTFMVNGQEKNLSYIFNGIDYSDDFIGNTYHGMATDDEGRYITDQETFDWWKNTISAHENMNEVIAAYKEKFDRDEVDRVVQDWIDTDIDNQPAQVAMGLEQAFGSLKGNTMSTNIQSDVANKFHKDYDNAAEAAEVAGNEPLRLAAVAASEAYDLAGMMAIAYGSDSEQYKNALETAKQAAVNYANIAKS